jgi:DNA-binding IclR family transcriptional regulator/sugar lactone lactonase YvrE
MTTNSSGGTAALDKALDVLDLVGQHAAGLSQAEIAGRLGMPRTTVYRLLGTLVARNLLRRDPQRRVYCLGMRCYEYARAAYAMPDLVAAASAELRALRDMTGETTYLSALDGLESMSLERCDGAHSERSQSALGQRKPLHCTSQGKAMLAALPPEQRENLVREMALPAQTPRTITERRRLNAELRLTAQRGWSIDDEELALGVRCCGAAIVDSHGQLRGAISVAGPAFRLTLERLDLIGPEIAEAARRIGAQLGQATPVRGDAEVQVVAGGWAFDGAHAFWHTAARSLLWADTLAPAVHRTDTAGAQPLDTLLATLDSPIRALLPITGSGSARGPRGEAVLVLAGAHWWRVNLQGEVQPLAGGSLREFSALTLDSRGQPWACLREGDRWRVAPVPDLLPATDDGSDATTLRSLNPGWHLAEPVTALAWSRNEEQLVLACADSGTLYSATPGQATLRRLATVPKGSGLLAGIALDAEGGIWCALRGGWSVVRFLADGTLDHVVALPVPAPTGVVLGGDGLRTLFITTARDAIGREALEAAPMSGRLLAVSLGG